MQQFLDNIFPAESSIPEPFQLLKPTEQSEYLINGQIHHWKGDHQKVFSPIHVKTEKGFDNYIGSYPLMGKEEALQALDAAVRAYDNGKGECPSMTIEKRISFFETFCSANEGSTAGSGKTANVGNRKKPAGF